MTSVLRRARTWYVRLAMLAVASMVVASLLVGCSGKTISPEEYAKISVEMMAASFKAMNPSKPVSTEEMQKMRADILSKYGYTEKEFEKSGKALMKDPATAQRIQTMIAEEMKKMAPMTPGAPGAPPPGVPGGLPAQPGTPPPPPTGK
ncbi:MAG: DUF4296 domain-containing protein [Armatimonadota bacterium]